MRLLFDKIANSPSLSLLLWVGSFLVGIASLTVFAPQAYADWAHPAMLGSFLLVLAISIFIKNKTIRSMIMAGLFLLIGVTRYLSTPGDAVDFLKFLPALAAAKSWLVSAVNLLLPEPHAGFLNGLLVGGGAGSSALKAAFVATGTAHVMALSGWNISLINKWLGRAFLFFRFRKKACWIMTTACVIVFVVTTGAGASLVRAAVMSVVAAIATASGRRAAGGRAVLYAATLMLFVSPRIIITDIGFLLSLSATLGLVYLSPFFEPFANHLPKRFDLRGTAAATIGATLATLPVTLVAFGQTSLVALPTNLFLLPFVAPTMLVGFLGAVVSSLIPSLLGFCSTVTMLFTNYDISVVKLFARVPGASVTGLSFNMLSAALMVAGMALMVVRHHDDIVKKEN
jgi:ComEC/Rec2-related protein